MPEANLVRRFREYLSACIYFAWILVGTALGAFPLHRLAPSHRIEPTSRRGEGPFRTSHRGERRAHTKSRLCSLTLHIFSIKPCAKLFVQNLTCGVHCELPNPSCPLFEVRRKCERKCDMTRLLCKEQGLNFRELPFSSGLRKLFQ